MALAGVVGLDRRLERWVVHHRNGWLDHAFVWLTRIGSYGAVWLALGLVVAIALRRPRVFLLILAADLIADGLAALFKDAIGRRRPPLVYAEPAPLVHAPHDSAFPSGHAATSFACATLLSFVLPRAAPGFFVLALAIAFSRVYVDVHWPADVFGGAVLGVATALLLLGATRWRSSRARRAS